nr:uncharacterized protein LOC126054495 [Helicoverpa armigera]
MDNRRCEPCGTTEVWHTRNKKLKLLYFKFPPDQDVCREWLRVVGNEELVDLPTIKLQKEKYVCENHFAENDFNKKGNHLKRHAIPTLNLNASPLTDEHLAKFPVHMFRHSEEKGFYPSAEQTEQNENI